MPDSANDKIAQNQAKMDQATAMLGDVMPPIWRRMFENSVEAGFSEEQAMSLVKTYILAQCPGGVNMKGSEGF
jgi:hypothetical protein